MMRREGGRRVIDPSLRLDGGHPLLAEDRVRLIGNPYSRYFGIGCRFESSFHIEIIQDLFFFKTSNERINERPLW